MNSTAAEIRIGIAAWTTFIIATCAYCLSYQAFVSAVTPDFGRTLAIALREWGAWAVLAPWVLRRFGEAIEWRRIVRLCLSSALLAAALPMLVDSWTGERNLGASLALFWPRNLAMAIALLCIARLFVRGQSSEPVVVKDALVDKPTTLLVNRGADQCLIRIADIEHLSAAGNYIDIRARGQSYLLRSTMGQVEQMLPAEDFVRIHRSHIVHVREIERIRIERSGSGAVHLRGGSQLALSKSYRARLRGRTLN